eukprot:m.137549 g.137549  ORF g.137549 m.137549 type:complete len:146 (+) comp11904_c0_seq1:69-506(+)
MTSKAVSATALLSKCGQFKALNKNPRNLEMQEKQRKFSGFKTSTKNISYFNRLRLFQTNQHLMATLESPGGVQSVTTSTQEYNLQKHLYSYTSTTTARELAKVMAQRLKESGILSVFWDGQAQGYKGKSKIFIDTIRTEGISTKE